MPAQSEAWTSRKTQGPSATSGRDPRPGIDRRAGSCRRRPRRPPAPRRRAARRPGPRVRGDRDGRGSPDAASSAVASLPQPKHGQVGAAHRGPSDLLDSTTTGWPPDPTPERRGRGGRRSGAGDVLVGQHGRRVVDAGAATGGDGVGRRFRLGTRRPAARRCRASASPSTRPIPGSEVPWACSQLSGVAGSGGRVGRRRRSLRPGAQRRNRRRDQHDGEHEQHHGMDQPRWPCGRRRRHRRSRAWRHGRRALRRSPACAWPRRTRRVFPAAAVEAGHAARRGASFVRGPGQSATCRTWPQPSRRRGGRSADLSPLLARLGVRDRAGARPSPSPGTWTARRPASRSRGPAPPARRSAGGGRGRSARRLGRARRAPGRAPAPGPAAGHDRPSSRAGG